MKRYKVLADKIQDVKGFDWDKDSEVSEKQLPDDLASQLLADGKVEQMDGDYDEVTGKKIEPK